MPSLYAVFVGIDIYDGDVDNLTSSKKDVKALHNLIADSKSYNFHPNILIDHQATKTAVINSFEHFRPANGEDVCLFYFSGHGAEVKPPNELRHLGNKFESLVLHDSRCLNGADLTDQELRHLIGLSVKGKKFQGMGHFAVIMDCCHSGHGTRQDLYPSEKLVKSAVGRSDQSSEQFYGYKAGITFPITGNHIQLAACERDREAYDGLYTRELISFLSKNEQGNLSYREISNHINRTISRSQTPQLHAEPLRIENLPFLGGAVG